MLMFVGVAGFKPTMTDPNSVVLSVTPYPTVFKSLLLFSRILEVYKLKQIMLSNVKKPIIKSKNLKPKTIY